MKTATQRQRVEWRVVVGRYGSPEHRVHTTPVSSRRAAVALAIHAAGLEGNRGVPVFVESDEHRGQGGGVEHLHRVYACEWNKRLGRSIERNPGGF